MITELTPIKETSDDFDAIEEKIRKLFRDEIYYPLLAALSAPKNAIQNSADDLARAIESGKIEFNQGLFTGSFNATLSRELRKIGASWDRKKQGFRIPLRELPVEIRSAISTSQARFEKKLAGIDEKLSQFLPEKIADKLSISKNFDTTLWKTDRDFQASVKGITIAPELTKAQRQKIADEWQNNMRLYIKDFAEKEIKELRGNIQKAVFKGNRRESMIGEIQKSYGVSERKAKFLARQETSLLMTEFKKNRYQDAGVNEYKWGCVAGSKNHPVRPWHRALAGKIFKWDNPPITSKPGDPIRRNNPGGDFNCRCFATPIVRFKK